MMFSCKSRYACGRNRHSDSDEDSSYGFVQKTGPGNRTRAALTSVAPNDDEHIYGNVTFGYKPILKTRLSSAASSVRRRAPVKRTVSFSGVETSSSPVMRRPRSSFRPPPPCYSVAVRRASSFSTTRREAAEIVARVRQRMPLPHERQVTSPPPLPPCNLSRVTVDVHRGPIETDLKRTPPPAVIYSVSTCCPHRLFFRGIDVKKKKSCNEYTKIL